jgi:diketogulonate reductase-like aldo/keto reductase
MFALGGAASNGALLKAPVIKEIAARHHEPPAQIIIRRRLRGCLSVIPGATDHAYIGENTRVIGSALSDYDMRRISAPDEERRFFSMYCRRAGQSVPNTKLHD